MRHDGSLDEREMVVETERREWGQAIDVCAVGLDKSYWITDGGRDGV